MKIKGLFSSKNRLLIGFTVIELLVVIAVIGLLASIVLVSLGPAQKKARDSRRQADLRQINTAMELCYDDANCAGAEKYIDSGAGPNDVTNIDMDSNPCFLCPVPKDKLDAEGSAYRYTWTDGTAAFYCVYAKLEAEDNTYVCASNKGTQKKTATGYTPNSEDCCGLNASGCCCRFTTAVAVANCPGGTCPPGQSCYQVKCKPADKAKCPAHEALYQCRTAAEAACP